MRPSVGVMLSSPFETRCRCRTIDRKAAIGDGDDLVDKGRRCLTALQVRAHGRRGRVRQDELGQS
jgi:hypothetical protein